MKTSLLSMLFFLATLCVLPADTTLDADNLPTVITRNIAAYFPGSKVIAAERDGDADDDDREYDVVITYKDLRLELEFSAEGRLTDIDIDS